MNSSTTAPHQTHLSTLLQSGLGAPPTSAYGALGSHSQQDLARSRLAAANITSRPNEKTVYDQIRTLISKWDPHSIDTILEAYLYNAVNAAYAPFYYRNADEQEEGWEAAMAKKPENITLDGGDVAFVPVLVRGFRALGARVEYQAQVVNEMRARLHEMNNSLDAVMKRHEQSLTLRVENARRQHAVLSQRCLRLAVKAQVLRHKNYPLDAAEESLRKTLMELEKRVFDPAFQAREEEIWARMVALRERARWLDEESKKLGVQLEEQKMDGSGVSDEILQKTKRILSDYDGQLRHLAKELGEVSGQFEEWEQSR
ncbi:nucleoporin complex subunit 54-domain-containing protein [Neohortaea acidophila]|uniref:Nucleoporin complex subunit 54-domain-containing protein n=1 Tax=Neohortaea acidophila TaxID=245834 RepID=A0A6A6PGH5_9PEZI|nr:nucleoporin complex subunit 54-domain-containing protein [Neohortaea acidophila]KAF2478886.1 nucleoporin complex subunit 54-domain-containing protein [Neohortaea acidophila]